MIAMVLPLTPWRAYPRLRPCPLPSTPPPDVASVVCVGRKPDCIEIVSLGEGGYGSPPMHPNGVSDLGSQVLLGTRSAQSRRFDERISNGDDTDVVVADV